MNKNEGCKFCRARMLLQIFSKYIPSCDFSYFIDLKVHFLLIQALQKHVLSYTTACGTIGMRLRVVCIKPEKSMNEISDVTQIRVQFSYELYILFIYIYIYMTRNYISL
jgi:hypothetical protein